MEVGDTALTERSRVSSRRPGVPHREHHVTKDYSHVHRDLLTIAGVGVVTIAFIVGMTFLVG